MTVPTRFGGSPGSSLHTRARLVLFALLMLSGRSPHPTCAVRIRPVPPRATVAYEPEHGTGPEAVGFRSAASFSGPDGQPPHVTRSARPRAGAPPQVLGYAFRRPTLCRMRSATTARSRCWSAHSHRTPSPASSLIRILEPYGYFGGRHRVRQTIAGKSVLDKYRVGDDVDAVSRASISVSSATRAIRDSVHPMARHHSIPSDVK